MVKTILCVLILGQQSNKFEALRQDQPTSLHPITWKPNSCRQWSRNLFFCHFCWCPRRGLDIFLYVIRCTLNILNEKSLFKSYRKYVFIFSRMTYKFKKVLNQRRSGKNYCWMNTILKRLNSILKAFCCFTYEIMLLYTCLKLV